MQSTALVLMTTAGGLGFLHAVLPDHWVPLSVLGRTQSWGLFRVGRVAALAGSAHVIASLVLAAVMVGIGLQFQAQVVGIQGKLVGMVLVLTAIGFFVWGQLSQQRHGHEHSHSHKHDHQQSRAKRFAQIAVPFGAAASPDLTVLPVALAASFYGLAVVAGVLISFGVITIASFVALTVACTAAGYQVKAKWIEKHANSITATALLIIGALVLNGL